ncbi:MAG: FAD-dependent oxidoreductase [Spirochaetota bacterium]
MKYTQNNRVVIIGAGFGGLWVAKTLFNTQYEEIVIDKNNYHTFLPLLYQVSAAEVSPEQIASPVPRGYSFV